MKRVLYLSTATALLLLSAPAAFADDAAVMQRLDRMQKMIDAQQKQIAAQKKEIAGLSQARGRKSAPVQQAVAMPPPPMTPAAAPDTSARLAQQDVKIDDLVNKFSAQQDTVRLATQEQPAATVTNGRLSIASADGRFSAALRLTGQYDVGYYSQSGAARALPAANGPDLSSGGNFRRAQIGLQGKVFGDWSYFYNMDFGSGGSSGTETPGHIQQAYLEYDGFAPFALRIGAHPPSTGLDDSYGAADSIFLERSAAADAGRNMGGGDGRDSIELLYTGNTLFGSLAYTGDKAQGASAFDEQQAVIARVAYTPIVTTDWRWVISSAATDVFRPADTSAALASARPFSISNPPELIVDDNSTKFVSASGANVTDAWNWNLESAVTYRNFLAQGGYFKYGIDLRGQPSLRGEDFHGWYAEGSWVLTGESRGWSAASGAFTSPKPRVNFAPSASGWGAFELAARYSTLDLNDNAGVLGGALPAGGVRGGEQRITSLALNWYPNPVLKFALQLQNTQVSKIGTGAAGLANSNLGQNFDTIALRTQIAL